MTIQEAIKTYLDWWRSQIGYHEGPDNFTKYADIPGMTEWLGWYAQNQQWCDLSFDAGMLVCFGLENASKMTYQPIGACSALCRQSAQYYKDNGAWYTTPQPGDQIFFGDINDLDHTGIVQKVTDAYVYTIEGNKNNQVQSCKYSLGNKSIAGYGRPDWSIVDGAPEPAPAPTPAPATGYTVGDVYTIVASALNVRQGAGTNYPLVGYDNLTIDGKRHAYRTGALMYGTRVTCLDIKLNGSDVWMQIPSGWCCAIYQGNTYIK
jgi:hypothetical protein